MWSHCICLNPFHGVCLHHGQFSSCSRLPHISLLQGLKGFPTGSALPGPGVRAAPPSSIYVWLFHHLMGSKMSLAPQAGQEVCLACSPGTMYPTYLQVSLPAQLWVQVLPADSQPTWPHFLCFTYTEGHHKVSGHPGDKITISRWKRGQHMWTWVPSCDF